MPITHAVITGAGKNNLQQPTEIARHMPLRRDTSAKLVPIRYVAPHDDGLLPTFQRQPCVEAITELVDAGVRRLFSVPMARGSRRAPGACRSVEPPRRLG